MQEKKLTANDLEKELKKAADVLRKSLNASENYKLVLPLLFVKKLNDDFIEKAESLIKEEKLSREEAYENPRRHKFFLPKDAEYRKLQEALKMFVLMQKLTEYHVCLNMRTRLSKIGLIVVAKSLQ
ncbi:MAG: type I restriction-modification system subunit M N-terminal domain-containing protein [Nitrosopumilaceae archaeon]